jgi:hypothetical protein
VPKKGDADATPEKTRAPGRPPARSRSAPLTDRARRERMPPAPTLEMSRPPSRGDTTADHGEPSG